MTVFRDQYTILSPSNGWCGCCRNGAGRRCGRRSRCSASRSPPSPLAAIYYPPNWLLRLLPFPLGYNASVALHHALAAAGAYALLRHRRVGRGAAALGGMLFAFGGLCVAFDNMINALQSATWLPWTLLAFDVWCVRRGAAALAATPSA